MTVQMNLVNTALALIFLISSRALATLVSLVHAAIRISMSVLRIRAYMACASTNSLSLRVIAQQATKANSVM